MVTATVGGTVVSVVNRRFASILIVIAGPWIRDTVGGTVVIVKNRRFASILIVITGPWLTDTVGGTVVSVILSCKEHGDQC
jgi:hypothetical protein